MELNEEQKAQFRKIKNDSFYLLANILEQSNRHKNEKNFLDDLTKQVTVIRDSAMEKISLFKENIINEIELYEAFEYFSKGLSILKKMLDSGFEADDMEVVVPNDRIKLSEYPPVHIVRKLDFDNIPDLEPVGDGLPFFPSEDENEFTLAKNQLIANLAMILNQIGDKSFAFPLLNNLLESIMKVENPEDLAKIDMQKMVSEMINQNMFLPDPVQAYKKNAINDLKQFLEERLEPHDVKELYDTYSSQINAATTEDEIKQCGEKVSAETRKRISLPASPTYKEQVINELKKLSEQNLESDDVNELYEVYSIKISMAETLGMVNKCREEAWSDINERVDLASALAMSLQY